MQGRGRIHAHRQTEVEVKGAQVVDGPPIVGLDYSYLDTLTVLRMTLQAINAGAWTMVARKVLLYLQ